MDELKRNNNYIIAEIYIEDEDIDKDIRILNSYEQWNKMFINPDLEEKYMNEKEIKECQIKINDEIIPFNYFHKFNSKGNYTIKYSFSNYLTNINHMFSGCHSLININLSNFNTQKVTNTNGMFWYCSSLKNIDLSNFSSQNVIDMNGMFFGCFSLTNINLSNCNTQNVIDMTGIFFKCYSLKKENVITKDKRILEEFEWGII